MASIISSTFSPISIDTHTSLSEFFTKYNPDDVAAAKVVHVDTISGKSVTYGGLRRQAASCAWGLKKLGVQEGDVVMAVLPSSTDFVILAHSVWWAGAVLSPVNTSSTAKDVAHCIDVVKPTHIFASGPFLPIVRSAISSSDLGTSGMGPKIFSVLDRVEGLKKFPEDISGTSSSETLPPYSLGSKSGKETTALVCFSSGTTGKMKGVQLSHFNLISNVYQYRISTPARNSAYQSEVFFPPYCHIYGLSTVILLGMWVGNFTCALPGFDLRIFCQKMDQYKATWAHIVPPVALLLANSEIPLKFDLSTLEMMVVAASPLKPALQSKLKTRFPKTKVLQGYGLSECSPGVMFQLEKDERKIGTCGRIFAGTEVRLVSPLTGRDVSIGEEGELWVRGPQVMMGYYGNVAATNETFAPDNDGQGRWLRTGDIMTMDPDHDFFVTDRLKEMIKYKGFQIAPSELEDLLLRHEHVVDAAVCAIYDEAQATEVPMAYVSLVDSHKGLAGIELHSVLEGVKGWINGKVAGYKKLRGGVHHLQELPKTTSGKILRRELPAKIMESRVARL